jgi:hypothetical protein
MITTDAFMCEYCQQWFISRYECEQHEVSCPEKNKVKEFKIGDVLGAKNTIVKIIAIKTEGGRRLHDCIRIRLDGAVTHVDSPGDNDDTMLRGFRTLTKDDFELIRSNAINAVKRIFDTVGMNSNLS